MQKQGLKFTRKKRFKITTDSAHKHPVAENKLIQNFTVSRFNEVWVSDITYIRIALSRWLYLTTIMDLFDRKIVGWALSGTLKTTDTSLAAFTMALANRPVSEHHSLIFHSDRGVQYASNEFTSELAKHTSITQSMSRKGTFWDNAVAESFFNILKKELVSENTYNTRKQGENSISDYIENYYNKVRRHGAINNLTISEFQKSLS